MIFQRKKNKFANSISAGTLENLTLHHCQVVDVYSLKAIVTLLTKQPNLKFLSLKENYDLKEKEEEEEEEAPKITYSAAAADLPLKMAILAIEIGKNAKWNYHIYQFWRAISKMQNLEHLLINAGLFGGFLSKISEADCPKLQELNLCGNAITYEEKEAQGISTFVKKCTSLKALSLGNTEISHEAIEYLALAIKTHPNLKLLKLKKTKLTEDSIETLCAALCKNESITTVDIRRNGIRYTSADYPVPPLNELLKSKQEKKGKFELKVKNGNRLTPNFMKLLTKDFGDMVS